MGRNGDHALISFRCDLYIFRKLKKRNPIEKCPGDDLLMGCVWRINLDAMWIRAESTVEVDIYRVLLGLRLSSQVGLSEPYEHFGLVPYK